MRERSLRQSFLGERSDEILQDVVVGIVGLGGGGSHIAQQLAHLGVKHFMLCDPDFIEETNLNRLIGATAKDVEQKTRKTIIAERLITGIHPGAQCIRIEESWETRLDTLSRCDAIFGCLDSYMARDQLERFSRRFLIPYFDIGMDVHDDADHFSITGQVIRSMPGEPCMRCLGVIHEDDVNRESLRYGAAGGKPQVVWSNGILASTAVGLFLEIITPWHFDARPVACLDYDGNRHTVVRRGTLAYAEDGVCPHHKANEVGDPFFSLRPAQDSP